MLVEGASRCQGEESGDADRADYGQTLRAYCQEFGLPSARPQIKTVPDAGERAAGERLLVLVP